MNYYIKSAIYVHVSCDNEWTFEIMYAWNDVCLKKTILGGLKMNISLCRGRREREQNNMQNQMSNLSLANSGLHKLHATN